MKIAKMYSYPAWNSNQTQGLLHVKKQAVVFFQG